MNMYEQAIILRIEAQLNRQTELLEAILNALTTGDLPHKVFK
jgi:hypothetical protein